LDQNYRLYIKQNELLYKHNNASNKNDISIGGKDYNEYHPYLLSMNLNKNSFLYFLLQILEYYISVVLKDE